MKKSLAAVLAVAIVAAVAAGVAWKKTAGPDPDSRSSAATASPAARPALLARLAEQVAYQRKLVVLFADDATRTPADAARGHQVGEFLFHANLEKSEALAEAVVAQWRAGDAAGIDAALDDIESAPGLFAVDRLVFKDLLLRLRDEVASAQTLGGVKLHKRLGEDLDAFDDIERLYDRELSATLG